MMCVGEQDRRLASHVLSVHKEGRAPAPTEGPERLSPDLLRAYIAAAKSYDPHFPRELTGAPWGLLPSYIQLGGPLQDPLRCEW